MFINLQISDKVYQELVTKRNRVQGTIGLVSPSEGNFNVHARNMQMEDDVVHKMAHGNIRINRKRTSVRLWFDHEEELVDVPMAIDREGREASGFAYKYEMINSI